MLARAFVPDQAAVRLPAESLAALGTLFEDLSEQLEPDAGGEEAEDSLFVNDRGFGRLSAAAAILRLARAHDARMPPSIFQKLALVIQVPFSDRHRHRHRMPINASNSNKEELLGHSETTVRRKHRACVTSHALLSASGAGHQRDLCVPWRPSHSNYQVGGVVSTPVL